MTDATATAEKLLQIEAVKLSPEQPFTWASGWKSPIYCDNRKILSFPYIRDYIKSELSNLIFEKFPDAGLIAGVATAGIPWGALVADQLKLPFIYARPKRKEHGLGNQIEGYYTKGQKTVVVEDLISSGKSSLEVARILRQEEINVSGMVSIFTYGFMTAQNSFSESGIPLFSLTDYPTLILLAQKRGLISSRHKDILLKWREDPANWTGVS